MTTVLAPAWRPLHDEPLFVPELLHGPDAVDGVLRDQIIGYLTQVAEVRKAPLHTCTAFNALHFGFDLQTRGYRHEVLDPDLFVPLQPHGQHRPVLPVGTFVRIDRGGLRSLWAEVVARYGADPAIEADGWVPAGLSGAPVRQPGGGPSTATERILLDMEAFGAPLSPAEHAELYRLRRRGTLLDSRGHLPSTADYPEDGPDARDDLGWYARHLLTAARPLLTGGPLGGLLTDPDDDEVLAAALHQALATVDALLDQAAGLRRWHRQATPRHRFERHRRSGWPGLDANAVDDVVRELARGSAQPRHTAVWPLLSARTGADEDPLELTGAAEIVTHVNLACADLAGSGVDGMLPDGIHLRVDDLWQAGGIWRSQRTPVPAGVLATHPLTPLGLGHQPAFDATEPNEDPAADPDAGSSGDTAGIPGVRADGPTLAGPETPADADATPLDTATTESPGHGGEPQHAEEDSGTATDGDTDVVTDVEVTDSLVVYTVALRETHWENDELPLPDVAAAVLADGPLLVELHHLGDILDDVERMHTVERGGAVLRGIAWPLSFYAGIKVTVAVARGARRLSASTTLLGEPLPFGEDYRWDANLAILAASLGVQEAPGLVPAAEPAEPDGTAAAGRADRPQRWRGVDQLRGLIVAALRRHGAAGAFGARRLDGLQLRVAMFGPDLDDPDILRQIVYTCERLVNAGALTCEPHLGFPDRPGLRGPDTFVWWPDDTACARALQHDRAAPATPVLRGQVREHWVPPHCRLLPPGYRASETAREAYAAWIRTVYGPDASTTLPDGCTFVRGGPRGSLPDGSWLHQAAEALPHRKI